MTDGLTQCGVRPGDVIHVRSDSLYGRGIRKALPGSWGNHDGIVVWKDGWGVAEALLRPGFVVTPWEEYRDRINAGNTSVAFFRPLVANTEPREVDSLNVMMHALDMARENPRYDALAICTIFANIVLKTTLQTEREWAWYCTEAVARFHRLVNVAWDVWGKRLPTTYTTEKRHRQGRLKFIGTVGTEPYEG